MSETARILLVQGGSHLPRVNSRLLEGAGYEVIAAETGAEALRLAQAQNPDLSLLDVILPDMDGFELCRRIKEDPNLAHCFVVMLGDVTPPSDDQASRLQGRADGYVARPISDQELLAWVEAMLRIKRAEARVAHLSRVLRAINNVNQLIVREKDRDRLLQDSCDVLVAARGYYNVWIALFDQAGRLVTTAEAGVGEAFLPLVRQLKRGELPDCARRALAQAQVAVSEEPPATCTDCPLAASYAGRGAMTVRLERGSKVYGLLCASVPAHYVADEEEQVLLREVAGDIAFALHSIELAEERKGVEAERQAHLRFLESMDRVNRAMQGTNDLEQMMSDVLDVVLSVFDCDRVFLLYPCDPESSSWRSPMERNKPEYPGILALGLEVPMDAEVAETLRILLNSDGPVKLGPGAMHPLPTDVSQRFGLKSCMSMALRPKVGKPWQFGIHQCSYPRIWTSEEERLFQEIGRRLSDSLTSLLVFRSLRESEARYRRIVDAANEGIWVLGEDLTTTFVNAKMADMLGYTCEEMLGRPVPDFMFAEDVIDHSKKMENRRQGMPEHYERRFRRKDGETMWVLASATPIFDDEQCFQGTFAMLTDITERKRAEEALQESEAKYMDLYENAPDMYASVNAQTALIEQCNHTLANALGYAKEEITGRPVFEIYHPDCLKEVEKTFKLFAETGEIHDKELQLQRKDGSKLDVSLNVSSVRDRGGNILYSRSTLRDITERKRNDAINASRLHLMQFAVTHSLDELLEETLNEAEKLADSLIGFYHFVEDDQESLTLQNWSTRTKADFCQAEGKGLHYATSEAGVWVDCVHQRKPVIHNDYASLPHRKGMPAGHAEVIRELVVPVLRGEKIKAILGVGNKPSDYTAQDVEAVSLLADLAWEIAERKLAEETLRRLNRELQALGNCNQVLLRAIDEQTLLDEICRIVCDEAGYRLAWVGYAEHDDAKTVRPVAWAGFDREYVTNARLSWADDTERGRGAAGQAIRSGEIIYVQDFETDPRMTPWRESALQRGYHSGIALPLKDESGQVFGVLLIYHSQPNAMTPDEVRLMGDLADDLAFGITVLRARIKLQQSRQDLQKSNDLLRAIVEAAPTAIIGLDLDGRVQTVWNPAAEEMLGWSAREAIGRFLPTVPQDKTEEFRQFREWIRSGQTMNGVEVQRQRQDGTPIDYSIYASPLHGPEGQIAGNVAVLVDITERKRAEEEREKLQAQLFQAQKMEVLGRLAGGVAHDFNNMLLAILSHTELAMMQCSPSEPIHADLQVIEEFTYRSADLVRQLLAFARKQTVVPKVLDLNDTVAGMLKMLRRLVGEDIDLVWVPGAGVWPIKIGSSQIDQILANLCINARDAIAGVGNVLIETRNVVFDEAYCAVHAGFVCGEFVMLAVGDDGCGMTQDIMAHIFEPFFTTKEVGKGTGLGLATIYGIVKQNEGFINVYSEPNKGSTFEIYLPRFVGKAAGLVTASSAELPKSRGETVLMVEDEAVILNVGQAILEELGYRVLVAGTPSEALRQIEAHAGEIHLLIADVILPEMNGRDLAELVGKANPELKVLFMSGYTDDVISHHGVRDEGVHFLQKPFSMLDLASKVREVLG